MALIRASSLAVFAVMLAAGRAAAQQAPVAELSISAGASTEDVEAAATELSVFGEIAPDFRFYVEGAWASRSEVETDAFGAAYPYDKRVRPIEAYAEKLFRGEKVFAGVKAGRYRTPFGIHARSDHAYSGFLRAPLVRYDGYWAISNNFLEGGVDVVVGTPALQFETSLGVPQDVGAAERERGLDRVFRVQGYRGPLIVGVSRVRSRPYMRGSWVHGDSVFTGVDFRWMMGGAQLRGEWITGQPFERPSTTGWYLDATLHKRALGPVVLVARAEELDYDAGAHSSFTERYTTGARIQLSRALVAHVNVIHEPTRPRGERTALDGAVTYVIRSPW